MGVRFCDLEGALGILPPLWDDVEATPKSWKTWSPAPKFDLDAVAAFDGHGPQTPNSPPLAERAGTS